MSVVFRTLCAACAVICCAVCGRAQAGAPRAGEVEAAVFKISEIIRSNYVYEERGGRIAAHLVLAHRAGRFRSAGTWAEFAALSTEVLRGFSRDGHLYVVHDPAAVKNLLAERGGEGDSGGEGSFFYGPQAREKNFGFAEARVLKGNIGYLKLSEINISEKSLPTLLAAFEFVSRTGALILDLRDNGGGGSEIGPVLESLFLPKNTPLLEFRTRTGQATLEKTVPWLTVERYAGPLFIIVNRKTASAAEAVAFALQAHKRAVIVGQTSAGAAHMNTWYVVNDAVFVSVSTGAPALPGTERSWEGTGVRPDYPAAAGEEVELIVRKLGEGTRTMGGPPRPSSP